MSKKQYLDMPIGRMGSFERVLELYEDGILQRRFRYSTTDQFELVLKYEDEGYREAASHSDVRRARKELFQLSQRSFLDQNKRRVILLCIARDVQLRWLSKEKRVREDVTAIIVDRCSLKLTTPKQFISGRGNSFKQRETTLFVAISRLSNRWKRKLGKV